MNFGMMQIPQQVDPQVAAWFAFADKDRSGAIGSVELSLALSQGGQRFSPAVSARLIAMFDRDNSGTISVNEFGAAWNFIQQMSAVFRQRDADGSGTLSQQEVASALAASGYQLPPPAFGALWRKFADTPTGISFANYIELSIVVGAVRNTFAWFDRQQGGRGQITLDFGAALALACSAL